jgi:DNA-binding beta-propeller fold protein YncE
MGIGPIRHARVRVRTCLAAAACLLVTQVALPAGYVLASPAAVPDTAAGSSATSGGATNPLLVTNVISGTVSAIGPSWNVTLGVGTDPWGVAFTPDDQYAYVVNGGSGTVSMISDADTSHPVVSQTLAIGTSATGTGGIAVTPDGQYAYVTNSSNSNNTGYNVAVIGGVETASPAVSAHLTVGDFPSDVAITPDGQYAYITDGEAVNSINSNTGAFTVIDGASTADPTVGQTVAASYPQGTSVHPVYVTWKDYQASGQFAAPSGTGGTCRWPARNRC